MVKVVFFCKKKPGMDSDDFRRHWIETQGSLAAKIPGMRKYVQHHIVATLDGSQPAWDGYAEVWFDDQEALERGFATPEADAATADMPNFLDPDGVETFIVEEVQIL
jgi:uncharacterized protein (TIGR02118 family)